MDGRANTLMDPQAGYLSVHLPIYLSIYLSSYLAL